MMEQKTPVCMQTGVFLLASLHRAEAGVDLAEYVADHRAEDHKRSDDNNGNQNKDQRIFDQALAFLFRGE